MADMYGVALRRWLGVDENESHAAGLGSPVCPGMIGTSLDDDAAGLQVHLILVHREQILTGFCPPCHLGM